MDILIAVLNLTMVIVFFVMSSNISAIRKMNNRQIQQNDQLIELIKKSTGQMTTEDKAKAFDQRTQ
jgi:hypothetical protein